MSESANGVAKKARQSTREFGEADYREGALERLADASHLLRSELFAGSVYLCGRSVEGMLRAVIWKKDDEIRMGRKSLDTGHDLWELLKRVGNLGLLRQKERDDLFRSEVQRVGRLWFNNMRFSSTRKIERDWRNPGELRGRRTLKQATAQFYDACTLIVKRCEALL